MSYRFRACSIILTAAANEAHRRGILSLSKPNRNPLDRQEFSIFHFTMDENIRALAYVTDWCRDEARLGVALWPSDDAENWIGAGNAKNLAGDVWTSAYLDRQIRLRFQTWGLRDSYIKRSREARIKCLSEPSLEQDPLRLFDRYRKLAA